MKSTSGMEDSFKFVALRIPGIKHAGHLSATGGPQ